MRKRTARAGSIAGVVALLLSFAPAARAGDSSDRLSETRRQLRAARNRLYEARRTDADLVATINVIGANLNSVQAKLAATRSYLTGVEARISATQRLMTKLDTERQAYAAGLGARARQMYIMGPASAEAWLGSDSMTDFLGRSAAVEFATRFDQRQIEGLTGVRHEEARLSKALAVERERVRKIESTMADQASVVWDALATKQQAEDALSARIAAYRDEVSALQAQENAIEALILSRSSVWTGAISRQGFAWPIRGAITSPYGPRWGGFHTGVDIDCTTGDPIGASKAGRVIAAEWGGGYGNMVIIDHGGGITTLYAHNSRLLVSQGQTVRQHQTISLCGATGHATGDHLHFEVRINGQHTNPMNFLP